MPFLLFTESLDFDEAVMPATVDTGAADGGFVPGIGAVEVAGPERPGSALIGPDGVNFAAAALCGFGQEDTVFGGLVFYDAGSVEEAFEVLSPETARGHLHEFGDPFRFFSRDPDKSLVRTGAAVSATKALKIEPPDVPLFFPARQSKAPYHFRTAPVSAEVAMAAYLPR